MELMSLAAIGWIAILLSGAAILIGGWLIASLHLQGGAQREQLARRVIDDTVLFGIWFLGLAGGIGLLLEKSWSRWAVELFCWVLAALVLMSSYSRLRVAEEPKSRVLMGHLLFIIPVIAFCAAAILTLRSDAAQRLLGQ